MHPPPQCDTMGEIVERRWLMRRFLLSALMAALFLSGCGAPASPVTPPAPADPPPVTAPTEVPAESLPETAPDAKPEPEQPAPAPAPEPELSPESQPEPADDAFVSVTDWIPGIYTDLRYASDNNFTGQVIYDFSDACLRYGTVRKLAAAQKTLEEAGYSLLIWDAFRPVSAQFRLWDICPDPAYVANPEKGYSSHSRGNTVDLTLVTPEGESVEMPTDFDNFTAMADRDYSDVSEEAASHARLLEEAMTAAGFRPYSAEWWHYSDTERYPVEEAFIPES